MRSVTAKRPQQNRILRFLKTPKGTLLVVLVVLTLIGLFGKNQSHGAVNLVAALLTATAVDFGVSFFLRPLRILSDGGIITALIVAGILSASAPVYVAIVTTALAVLSKHVAKLRRKPLLNPAGFGLLVAVFLFPTGQSWWSSLAMVSPWFIILLLASGLFVAHRVNKLPQVFTYLGTYFALLLIMAFLHLGLPSDTPADALRPPFINSALFLAFFMLTDPPTSPSKYRQQVYFGVIAAFCGTLDFALQGGLAYLLMGLLVANLWKAYVTRKPKDVRDRYSAVSLSNRKSTENWYV